MAPPLEERLYRSMKRIRRFEEVTAELYPSDKIKSPIHLAIGQEQVAVAVCDLLGEHDWVGGSYRSHAMYLAKGGSMDELMAEMYGKAAGCSGGKGGSMHVISLSAGVIGSSAVVASQIPVGAGYALAAKHARRGAVVAVFMGDGATEEGCFYETLNFAALRNLPMLFVVENNGLAIHEPLAKRRADPEGICRVAEALGVPATRIEDGDIFSIRDAADEALAGIRAGSGPRLLEALVFRQRQHVGPNEDYEQGYRSRAEAERWLETDPLPRLAAKLAPEHRQRIDAEIEAEILTATRFAEGCAPPSPDELFTDVYA